MRRLKSFSPGRQFHHGVAGRRPSISAASLLAAICLSFGPAPVSAQATVDIDAERGVSYAVKFLCGGSREDFQEGVVRGVHATAIHILNPSFSNPVRFAKRVSRALPYQASGTLTGTRRDEIGPNLAI